MCPVDAQPSDGLDAGSLNEVLLRTAFFAETHSIKGWLAAHRLIHRFPALRTEIANLGQWYQLLSAPSVDGLLSAHVAWDTASLDDRRLRSMIRRSVFPIAYAAAVEWVRRHGLTSLIAADSALSTRRLGNLGHSFTIHRSFVELTSLLKTDEQRFLCAERYAEFVASQLAETDAIAPDATPLDGPALDEASVFDAVFRFPGVLGHTAITLAYLLRYRAELDPGAWRFATSQLVKMALPSEEDATSIRVAPPTDLSEASLAAALLDLVEHGPREVHTVTLADAMCSVWDALPDRRGDVEQLVRRFARLTLPRTAGGERAKSP